MWYNKGSVMLYPKGKKSRRVCLRVVQGGNYMKRKDVLNAIIGFVSGATISAGMVNGILYSNIVLFGLGLVWLIIFLLYLLWYSKK